MSFNDFAEVGDNYRIVDTGKSKYKIIRDGFGDSLWHIETDHGQLPVALRNKKYTTPRYAMVDIKNYLAGAAERSIVYSSKRKNTEG